MGSASASLLKAFLALCLLRLKPQDLPHSGFLLRLMILANFFATTILYLYEIPLIAALLLSALANAIALLLTYLVLYLCKYPERYTQVATALFGTDALLTIPALMLRHTMTMGSGETTVNMISGVIFLSLLVWNLVIMAHILSHALDSPFVVGFLVSIGFVFFTLQAIYAVQPFLIPAS